MNDDCYSPYCPKCRSAAERKSRRSYRCRACHYYFPLAEAIMRRLPPKGMSHNDRPQDKRYRGKPAGRIVIPQYRWL